MKLFFRESPVPIVLATLLLGAVLGALRLEALRQARQPIVVHVNPGFNGKPFEEVEAGARFELTPRFSFEETSGTPPSEAKYLVISGKWREAEEHYEKLAETEAASRALNDLGILYYLRGDEAQALSYLDSAVETQPRYPRARLNRGVVLAGLGDFEAALKDLEVSAGEMPSDFDAQYALGLARWNGERRREALGYFQRAAELSSGEKRARALYRAGEAHRSLGAPESARRCFELALRLEPTFLAPRYGLAALAAGAPGGRARALGVYREILRTRSGHAPTYYNLAKLYEELREPEEALRWLREAVSHWPDDRRSRLALGKLLLARDEWREAREHYEWVLALDARDADAHFGIARAEFGLGRFARAVEHYEKAAELRDGSYPEAFLNMGLALQRMGRLGKAIASYKNAIEIKGRYPEAHYNLGMVYLREENWKEAAQALTRAVEEAPSYPEAWYNLGILFTRWGRTDQAIRAYRRALEARPGYLKARLNLGVRYADQGRYADAIREYRTYLGQYDRSSSAWYNLGVAYARTGELAGAEDALRRVLQLEPGHAKATALLGSVLFSAGDHGPAVPLLRQAVRSEPERADLRVQLARVLVRQGKRAEARRELERGLRLTPDDPSLRAEWQALIPEKEENGNSRADTGLRSTP
ncbi:MAG: tetratricopeptide repeat protein [Deltaproteobacteria bacterium]|nr:tetratricopeptide repeat protein [Deltaproteobacteria bacterium]